MKVRALSLCLVIAACDTSRPMRAIPDAGCLPDQADREVWVDTTCHFARCSARVSRGAACELTITLGACPEDTFIRAIVPASGPWEFENSVYGLCELTTAPNEAFLAIQCDDCRFDFYEKTELDLEVRRINVYDVPLNAPLASLLDPLDADDPLEGYLASMVVLPDRVVVSSFDGRFGDLDCGGMVPNRIDSFDLETTRHLDTKVMPPCLTLLAPDPIEDGFLGIYGARSSTIGRFDRDGNLRHSERLRLPDRDERRGAVALTANRDAIQVLISGDETGATAYLLALDPTTLTIRNTSARVEGFMRTATTFDSNGPFAATDENNDVIHSFDRNTLAPGPQIKLAEKRRISNDPGFVTLTTADLLYVSSSGVTGSAWIVARPFSGTDEVGAAVFYEDFAVPWAAVAWPADPSKLLVGVTKFAINSYQARAAFLDPFSRRFLPGSAELGQGVVKELIPDRNGRVWALLPWSGEIVRIGPK